jgi:hypothetical protein
LRENLFVLCEVDDLAITGSPRLVTELKAQLMAKFNISQFEPMSSFLRTAGLPHSIADLLRYTDFIQEMGGVTSVDLCAPTNEMVIPYAVEFKRRHMSSGRHADRGGLH